MISMSLSFFDSCEIASLSEEGEDEGMPGDMTAE
jgi:hypothetical protein